jgi:predicted metal-binding protein
VKISVCTSCALGMGGFAGPLAVALAQAHIPAQVVEITCMSGCARPSAIAFRAPGKTAYLFGDLTTADLPDLLNFARLYADSASGEFTDARMLGALRNKALARIPGDCP